jgi:hypothetical protein
VHSPSPPVLRCRNATQTSVVLEWDPIELATSELRSLSLYRNGTKAGSIPRPTEITSTKISGLAVDTEYTFHLVLKTSAGTYGSEKLTVRTHKMTELHGITVTPGVMPAALRESLAATIDQIGAKMIDTVRIDTTHFVCTEGRGESWEKAVEMNIPVVVPDWVKGCEREGRLVGVRGYYLNADPRLRQVGPSVVQTTAQQQNTPADHPMRSPPPTTHVTPPTPERPTRDRRDSRLGNGASTSASDEPPTPPPKIDAPGSQASGSTTLVDRTSQALQKEMGSSKAEDGDDDDESSEDEDDDIEDDPSGAEEKKAVAGKKATVEDNKSESGDFQDVAL